MREFLRTKSGVLIIILIVLIQAILRIAMPIINDVSVDWWILCFDIIIFLLTNFFVCKISKKMFRAEIYSMFLCAINGFSAIFFASGFYLITYELSNLFVLIITYLHLVLWRKKNINSCYLLAIMASIIMGNLIHFSFFICAFALFVIYVIKCVKIKNYNNLVKYLAYTMAGFVASLFIGNYVYNPVYLQKGIAFIFNFSHFSLEKLKYVFIINYGFFHNLFLLFAILIGIVCYKKVNRKLRWNSIILLFVSPIVLYLIFTFLFSPEVSIEFLIPIYSITLVLILYVLKKFLFEHLSNGEAVFVLILLITIYAYNYLTGCLQLSLI